MKFYKDKSESLKCEIELEGCSLNEATARLVLEFGDGKNYLFHGSIDDSGLCEIKVPALKEISSNSGKAILEIIAESTFFTPWESEFEVASSKKVSIKEVKWSGEDSQLEKQQKSVQVKKVIQEKEDLTPKRLTIEVNKGISEKSRNLIKDSLKQFAKISGEDRKELVESLENYKPSATLKKWADKTFVDSSNLNTKVCIYLVEKEVKSSK